MKQQRKTTARTTILVGLGFFWLLGSAVNGYAQGKGDTASQSRPLPSIPFEKVAIITTQLAPHFFALTGSPNFDPGHPEAAGGRVGVLVGKDGVFMVDCSYAPLSPKITEAIGRISKAPIRFLVNTHYHPDHTGGNPNFARQGVLVISREETRDALVQPLPPALAAAIGNAASGKDPARLPEMTIDGHSSVKFYFDDDTIDLIPVRNAHTNGDLLIRFEKEDVIMIGDFYRNYGYPFVDRAHGGTFSGVLAAVDTVLSIAGPNTKLVPGHGVIADRTELMFYRDMILDIRARISAMIETGKTEQEVLAARLTTPYDAQTPGGNQTLPANLGTSAGRFVSALYQELKTSAR